MPYSWGAWDDWEEWEWDRRDVPDARDKKGRRNVSILAVILSVTRFAQGQRWLARERREEQEARKRRAKSEPATPKKKSGEREQGEKRKEKGEEKAAKRKEEEGAFTIPPRAIEPPAHPNCLCYVGVDYTEEGQPVEVWRSVLIAPTCEHCEDMHGTIISMGPWLGDKI